MPSTYWAKGVVILKSRRSSVVKRSMVGRREDEGKRTAKTPLVKYREINKIT